MLLFASGPIIGNQRALAANLAGSGLADPNPGISYRSPLPHWFGDVLHHGFDHFNNSGFTIATHSANNPIFILRKMSPSIDH
jgi:hypothetical protein